MRYVSVNKANVVDRLMKKYTLDTMRSICQKKKIPYVSLRKRQVAENMVAFKRKEKFPHVSKAKSIEEERKANHKITPAIRAFCFAYAMAIQPKTQKQWARKFGVNEATIYKWLQWEQVNQLIEQFQSDRETRMIHLFERYETEAFKALVTIVRSGEDDVIKLKAINDYFGYTGRVNSNRGGAKVVLHQEQKTGQVQGQSSVNSPFAELTDDALSAEIRELDNLLLEESCDE